MFDKIQNWMLWPLEKPQNLKLNNGHWNIQKQFLLTNGFVPFEEYVFLNFMEASEESLHPPHSPSTTRRYLGAQILLHK